jgi:hypothetical protein
MVFKSKKTHTHTQTHTQVLLFFSQKQIVIFRTKWGGESPERSRRYLPVLFLFLTKFVIFPKKKNFSKRKTLRGELVPVFFPKTNCHFETKKSAKTGVL